MKILALYREETPMILHRIKFPFHVLSERGHQFLYMQVSDFTSGLAYGADVTVLSNWLFKNEELADYIQLCKNRTVVYDLSLPQLLLDPTIHLHLSHAHLVTVPNSFLEKEVRGFNRNVVVLPSCIDVPYFMQANRVPRPCAPIIGCMGGYGWNLVRDAVVQLKEKYPQLYVIASREAWSTFQGYKELVQCVELTPQDYPFHVKKCMLGLLPIEGNFGRDDIYRHSYGILAVPTIQLQGSIKEQRTEIWVRRIEALIDDPRQRAREGQMSYVLANRQRSTILAQEYLAAYRKKLPQLH